MHIKRVSTGVLWKLGKKWNLEHNIRVKKHTLLGKLLGQRVSR